MAGDIEGVVWMVGWRGEFGMVKRTGGEQGRLQSFEYQKATTRQRTLKKEKRRKYKAIGAR